MITFLDKSGRVKGGAQLVDLDKMLEEKPYTRPKYSPPYWQDVLPKANDRKNVPIDVLEGRGQPRLSTLLPSSKQPKRSLIAQDMPSVRESVIDRTKTKPHKHLRISLFFLSAFSH